MFLADAHTYLAETPNPILPDWREIVIGLPASLGPMPPPLPPSP